MSVNAMTNHQVKPKMDIKTVTSLGMLTGIAYVVMLLSKMLPSVNGFLDFDFKDVVICIGGFIFGPLSAAAISIVVALIEMMTISHTGPIGLIMNILATCSFCCTASYVYKRRHTKTGAIEGLALGVVCLVGVMLLWNYLITPIYQGVPRDVVAAMLPTVFLPFNLVKGGLNMSATLLLYKPVVSALRKTGLVAPSKSGQQKKFNAGFALFSLALLATFAVWAMVLVGVI